MNIQETKHSKSINQPTKTELHRDRNCRFRSVDEVSIPEQLIEEKTKKAELDANQLKILNDKLKEYSVRVFELDKENSKLTNDINERKSKCISADLEVAERTENLWKEVQLLRYNVNEETRALNEQELLLKGLLNKIHVSRERIRAYREDIYAETTKLSTMQIENEEKKDQVAIMEKRLKYAAENLVRLEQEKQKLDGLLVKANESLCRTLCEKTSLTNELINNTKETEFYQYLLSETRSDACKILLLPSVEEIKKYKIRLYDTIEIIQQDFQQLSDDHLSNVDRYYKARLAELRREERQDALTDPTLDAKLKDDLTVGRKTLQDKLDNLVEEQQELYKEEAQLERFISQQEKLHKEQTEIAFEKERCVDEKITSLSDEVKLKYGLLNNVLESHANLEFEVCMYRNLMNANTHLEGHDATRGSTCESSEASLLEPAQVDYGDELSPASSGTQENSDQELRQLQDNSVIDDDAATGSDVVTEDRTEHEHVGNRSISKQFRGYVYIDDVDNNAEYVLLRNKSSNDVNLKDWSISRAVDEKPSILFKFMRDLNLRSKQSIKIFGGIAPSTTSEYVFSADLSTGWQSGLTTETKLIDENGRMRALFKDVIAMKIPPSQGAEII